MNKMTNTYFDLLPDEILEIIKRYIAEKPPPHLNLFDVLYFQYINKMNTKELIKFCDDNSIKKSRNKTNNQFCKRLNIIEKYLGREIKVDERVCIIFTRGDRMYNYLGWVI